MRRTLSPKDCQSCTLMDIDMEGEIDADNFRSGGLSIVGTRGKIDINNTLDERLKLLETDALPACRRSLFGKNANRRFYD